MRSYVGAISSTFEVLGRRSEHYGFSQYVGDLAQDVSEKVHDADYLCELLLKYGNLDRIEVQCHEVTVQTILEIITHEGLLIEIMVQGEILKKSIFLDEKALRTIIFNLLDNVFSHCGAKTKVVAEVSLKEVMGRSTIQINLTDNGPGIDLDYRESIFEAGERAGKKLDYHKGGGLGLGLPFARELARAHKHFNLEGDVFYFETEVQETCFTIIIPGPVQ